MWSIYLCTLAVSPSLGGSLADNTKETTKTMGVLLCSSSNDEGPGRVWMALLGLVVGINVHRIPFFFFFFFFSLLSLHVISPFCCSDL